MSATEILLTIVIAVVIADITLVILLARNLRRRPTPKTSYAVVYWTGPGEDPFPHVLAFHTRSAALNARDMIRLDQAEHRVRWKSERHLAHVLPIDDQGIVAR